MVALTQKLYLTISNNKLLLFTIILMMVFYAGTSNAQNNLNRSATIQLNVNPVTNIEKNKIINIDSRNYIDFSENNSGTNYELNLSNKNYSKIHGKFIPITGNVNELNKFFRALKTSRTKKIRVAHFGDSILLGDVITEDLRQNFQDKFGGNGIGFVSITPHDIRMKRSINQTVYGKWFVGSVTKGNPKHFPIGINCITAKATSSSSVKYQTTKFMRTSRSFKTARIFYSNAGPFSSINFSLDNGKVITKKLNTGTGIKQLIIKSSNLENSIKINFGSAAGTYFYGVSFETGNGVYVDNFPLNGNSGVSLTNINEQTLRAFDQYLNYKLIIFQFGVNATQLSMNFSWYKNKMVKVINHFKKAFPNASILVVSVGDKSIKRGARFVTDPQVLRLLNTQKQIVAKTNVAFWNLYDAMGGKNSLNKWVNAGPPLGLRDYIHFTNLGGKVVADLLTESLMKEFNKMR